MRYIGLDVHKNNISACVISAGGKVVKSLEVRANEHGLQTLHDYIGTAEYCVMMESSTYSYRTYRFFESLGVEVHVIHAKSLKVVTDTDNKTNVKDAEAIGKYLRLWKKGEIELSMSFIPTPEQCGLKDICRYKEELSSKLGDEVRRIRSHMERNLEDLPWQYDNLSTKKSRDYIRRTWPDDLTLMERLSHYAILLDESERVKGQILTMLAGDLNVELLITIPGIARQTAVQIMSMIIDVRRFQDPEKICSYFGMVPRVRDSGGKEHHGRMTKTGDAMMRSILERVTLSHILHCDSSVKEFYIRKEKEMGKKKALISASRKMLALIWSVLTNGRPFRA
ncbi:MAG: IS110 family transposase [Methanomassiliicoccaceae archaeon]|nr:IS110 family transposase [Methanomassiliicoccaceae archaeon]